MKEKTTNQEEAMAKTTTIVETLQEHLAAKRKAVADCEQALAGEREAAEAYLRERLAGAQARLEAAKTDLDNFTIEVGRALGLPSPAAARQSRQRFKKVADMVLRGMDTDAIANALGCPREVVAADVERLKTDANKEEGVAHDGPRGWKRERVLVLLQQGRTRDEIADEMGISRISVNVHVSKLLQDSRLTQEQARASLGTSVAQQPTQPAPPPVLQPSPRPPIASKPIVAPKPSDSVDDLRAEVIRQQGPYRGRAVKLLTTVEQDHGHQILIDRMGDGSTQHDDTGHVHRVFRFVVSQAAGHQHGVKIPTQKQIDNWD